MIDENRQAEALRRRLDQELAGVRATPEARERLDSQITPQFVTSRTRWELRRLPGSLVLPLAAASVVAAVVAVPALLRADDSATVPPSAGGSIDPTIPPTTTASPTPSPSESGPVDAAPAPKRTTPNENPRAGEAPDQSRTGAGLSLKASPSPVQVGSRMALSLQDGEFGPGDVTVNWGDRKSSTKTEGNCTVSDRAQPRTMAHVYTKPGKYLIKVVIDNCRTELRASVRVTVVDGPVGDGRAGAGPAVAVPSASIAAR